MAESEKRVIENNKEMVPFEHYVELLTKIDPEEAAARTAEAYRSAGWEELPVSTRTFKLFSRGRRTAALLVEDVPQGGTRVTEFRRGSAL